MRKCFWMLALLAGLGLAEAAHAQQISQPSGSLRRLSPASQSGMFSTTSFVNSLFRLRELFPSWGLTSTQGSYGTMEIPPTTSPEYLKAFGYKKLF